MRIDRLLWFLRFARSRGASQRWIAEGRIRRNGMRVEKLDQAIQPGDVLTLPLARKPLVIEIIALPKRRGPREEAETHYRVLDAGAPIAIAGCESHSSKGLPDP